MSLLPEISRKLVQLEEENIRLHAEVERLRETVGKLSLVAKEGLQSFQNVILSHGDNCSDCRTDLYEYERLNGLLNSIMAALLTSFVPTHQRMTCLNETSIKIYATSANDLIHLATLEAETIRRINAAINAAIKEAKP